MEIISRVSKGSKMDQIYIPKNRIGLSIGTYVKIKPVQKIKLSKKLYYHNLNYLEPLKTKTIQEITSIINNYNPQNIIITGSFLEKGFNFNDIDILIINDKNINQKQIKSKIENQIGIKTHLIQISNKTLIKGLSTDPLYNLMLNKCVSKKRLIYKIKYKINYKILDLHLIKSKTLLNNFNILNGNEKYYLTRNLISIMQFLNKDKITKEKVDKEIEKTFNIKIQDLKHNILNKEKFLKKYKKLYEKTFNKIMKGIKNGSK